MYAAPADDAQGRLLKEQLQLVKNQGGEPGGAPRYQIKPLQRDLSFDKGFFVCLRALQLLTQHNKGCVIVGVAGASGSGKTTFTSRLKKMLANVAVIQLDMYNMGDKVREDNFDDPRIVDYDTLLANLAALRAGRATKVPIYDFKQSARVGYEDLEVPGSRIILIEGIHALSQRLEGLMDLKIAITGGVHFDLVKRVMRDIQRSGQAAGEVIQQVSDTVFPMYKAFIEPCLRQAHIRVTNNFNPFAGFKEPIQILKTEESVTVEMVRECLREMFPGEPVTQEDEIEVHDIFLLPPGEDPQGCHSWLRMRNKEGRYSLMFAEYVVDEPFIVSPRVSFEVPVRILGGLMALGYTIGSLMSRVSFRVVARDVCVKWDRLEKLGAFVQVQGENRAVIKRLCDALGVTTFVPRSYIEQVQLLQLTEEFSTITDKARAHFDVGDDVIIDDHVIGTSPARQLVAPNGSLLRHSTDSSLRALAMEPQRQTFGFRPSAQVGPSGSGTPKRSGTKSPQRAQIPLHGSLSRDIQALSLEGCQPAETGACVEDTAGARASQKPGGAVDGPSCSTSVQQRGRSALQCVETARGRERASGDTAAHQNGGTAGGGGHSDGAPEASTPWFWERNRSAKGADAAAIAMDVRADIKAVAREVRTLAQSLDSSLLVGVAGVAAMAGCALGVAVTSMLLRR